MHRNWKTLLMILPLLAVGLAGTTNGQADASPQEYAMGRTLGTCLARGCVIFLGRVDAIGKPEPEPGVAEGRATTFVRVGLTITDWLYGKPEDASVKTSVIETMKPHMTKTSDGPWSAWEGVSPKLGGQLLIARWEPTAERARRGNEPYDLALVLSDMSLLSRVRQVTAEHALLLQQPEKVKEAIQRLPSDGNAMLAGYLVSYLIERDVVLDVDRATVLISNLIDNRLVPDPERRQIADECISNFYRLSDSTRATVTKSLFTLATRKERGIYDPAIGALLRLQGMQMLVPSHHLSPTERKQFLANCNNLVEEGKVPAGLVPQLLDGNTR